MADRDLKIAIKLSGVNFETGIVDTFYFSNSGFVAAIGGDPVAHYYEPYLKDGILFKKDAIADTDFISINLANVGQLDYLPDYLFNGYALEVYVSANYAPDSDNWYPMFLGTAQSVLLQRRSVKIKAASHFNTFENAMNPEVFAGIRGEYEGDPELQGASKPRLFGKVFNITPVLLRSDNLVYGCNWKYDGTRATVLEFTEVRDGGAPLTLDITNAPGGNYTATTLMDLYQPAAGHYVTCLSEGTFKLGSSPIYGLTTMLLKQLKLILP